MESSKLKLLFNEFRYATESFDPINLKKAADKIFD